MSDGRGPHGSAVNARLARAPLRPVARLAVDVVTTAALRTPGLGAWLRSVAPSRARGVMTIAVVPDARVRALNRQYRKQDRATDVLSFPSDERGYLGDVVIAAGVARRQARHAGHPLGTELRVLALHGLLHLLGYDHERDDGRMARLERRLRRRGALVEGLIERAIPSSK
jgi:probable rRNA maturation factor